MSLTYVLALVVIPVQKIKINGYLTRDVLDSILMAFGLDSMEKGLLQILQKKE
jgi:hypothetical protein